MMEALPELFGEAVGKEPITVNPVARAIVIGIGIVALSLLMFYIVRLLSRQTVRMGAGLDNDERETLEETAEDALNAGIFKRRKDPELGVRYYYRRYLQLVKARGGKVSQYMNTLQIRDENAQGYDAQALDKIREVYLPIRYGGRAATQQDAQNARAAYEALKKKQ